MQEWQSATHAMRCKFGGHIAQSSGRLQNVLQLPHEQMLTYCRALRASANKPAALYAIACGATRAGTHADQISMGSVSMCGPLGLQHKHVRGYTGYNQRALSHSSGVHGVATDHELQSLGRAQTPCCGKRLFASHLQYPGSLAVTDNVLQHSTATDR